MSNDTRSIKVLFREWQNGDSTAGEAMAQRVADWYYAIATSRLGESAGGPPCQGAINKFGEGVVQVREARSLVGWAHNIIIKELEPLGSRAQDGNAPCAYTNMQPPKTLLAEARHALPKEMELLCEAYSANRDDAKVQELAAPFGGNPIGILKARYKAKAWLRDTKGVPFEVAPENPILDRAPLPLYESGRMATPAEEVNFEHWMLTDINLCRDIAEFAHFAIALRGGVPEMAKPSPTSTQPTEISAAPAKKGLLAWFLGLFGIGK